MDLVCHSISQKETSPTDTKSLMALPRWMGKLGDGRGKKGKFGGKRYEARGCGCVSHASSAFEPAKCADDEADYLPGLQTLTDLTRLSH